MNKQGVIPGVDLRSNGVLACSLLPQATSHNPEPATREDKPHARRPERRIHAHQPPPPPHPPRWRRPRRRRGLLARYSTFPRSSSIQQSSSGLIPPPPPPRWNRRSPPGHRRRLSSSSNRQKLWGPGGRATPALPSLNRCRSSASTSNPTYTASTYLLPTLNWTKYLSLLNCN